MNMAVKIIKLITSEELVCFVADLIDNDNNKIGFNIRFPYQIVMRPSSANSAEYDVNYVAWMGTSSNNEFSVSYSSIVCIGEPLPEVEQLYTNRYNEFLEITKNDTDEVQNFYGTNE
jgi:hypothetical protein